MWHASIYTLWPAFPPSLSECSASPSLPPPPFEVSLPLLYLEVLETYVGLSLSQRHSSHCGIAGWDKGWLHLYRPLPSAQWIQKQTHAHGQHTREPLQIHASPSADQLTLHFAFVCFVIDIIYWQDVALKVALWFQMRSQPADLYQTSLWLHKNNALCSIRLEASNVDSEILTELMNGKTRLGVLQPWPLSWNWVRVSEDESKQMWLGSSFSFCTLLCNSERMSMSQLCQYLDPEITCIQSSTQTSCTAGKWLVLPTGPPPLLQLLEPWNVWTVLGMWVCVI